MNESDWRQTKDALPGKGQLVVAVWHDKKNLSDAKIGYRYKGNLTDVDNMEWVFDGESWSGPDPKFWLPLHSVPNYFPKHKDQLNKYKVTDAN